MERLRLLSGTWVGEGAGDFPSIEAFRYRETLRFELDESYPLLHYEQRTWRDIDGEEGPSHWETGFLRFLGEGRVEMVDGSSIMQNQKFLRRHSEGVTSFAGQPRP